MEGFFGFLAVLMILVAVMGLGVVGLVVWGVTRVIQSVAGLFGKKKTPDRMEGPAIPRGSFPGHAPQHHAAARPAPEPAHTGSAPGPGPSPSYTPAPSPRDYVYLDVDAGTTADDIVRVMRNYEQQRVVGFYAREVIDVLSMVDLRRKSLFGEIDRAFDKRSISWDHFATTATEALDALVRNCALLGNRVQSFDVSDYERMEQFYRTGGEMRNGKQDPARIKRWELLRATKDEMDRLRSANEGLLLELDKLSSELTTLSSNDSTEESSRIADEVRRLAEQTKYYR